MPRGRIYSAGVPVSGGGGNQVHFGNGAPSSSLGNVNDVYFDISSKNIYQKIDPVIWAVQTNYSAGITIQDETATIASNVTTLDFSGGDILASVLAGNKVQITSPPSPPPPPSFGYWSGGTQPSGTVSTQTDKMAFSNDTTAMTSVGTLTSVANVIGLNSSLKGYFGATGSPPSINSIVFASDSSMVMPNSFLPGSRLEVGSGAVNSTLAGYWAGFNTYPGGSLANYCEKLVFASDSALLTLAGSLTNTKTCLAGANSSTAGYFAGGTFPNPSSTACDKLTFATDTSAMTAAGVLVTSRFGAAGANSLTKGYFAGGSVNQIGPTGVTTCYGLDFATDSAPMTVKGSLGTGVYMNAGANSTLKAYFAGGSTGVLNSSSVNNCYALVFATDTNPMVSAANLINPRRFLGACQSGGIL